MIFISNKIALAKTHLIQSKCTCFGTNSSGAQTFFIVELIKFITAFSESVLELFLLSIFTPTSIEFDATVILK